MSAICDGGKVCGLHPWSTAEFPNENSVTLKPQLSLQSDLELASQVYPVVRSLFVRIFNWLLCGSGKGQQET